MVEVSRLAQTYARAAHDGPSRILSSCHKSGHFANANAPWEFVRCFQIAFLIHIHEEGRIQ